MTEIMRILAGSRLYGTATPQSDTDYKSVYLPDARTILLGKRDQVRSTSSGGSDKNSADDVDMEAFELQRYLQLAAGMQTIAVEMLFAPCLTDTPFWTEMIVENRDRILNANADAFVGYCKGQAVRYSLRGDRLNTFRAVVGVLEQAPQSARVADRAEALKAIPHVKFLPRRQPGGGMVLYMDVFGRQVPDTVKINEALKVYAKPVKEAGKRAQAAAEEDGADWKALYHAYRIADEGVQLFRDGVIHFPSRKRDFLMEIRRGEHSLEKVLDAFDMRMGDLQDTAAHTDLPDEPDWEWINDLVCETHAQIVRDSEWGH